MKGSEIHIFADVIDERLGVSCSALSGANIADEVATDRFSETTIGYRNKEEGLMWQKLFSTFSTYNRQNQKLILHEATPNFRVNIVEDVS